VTITDTALSPYGFIYWTWDGTNPNVNSPVYSGPLQVTQNVTFRSAAQASGCPISNVVVASYTVAPGGYDAPPYFPVVFNPPSSTSNNDLLVGLSGVPGATICYSFDGSVPACANGQCTGLTYDAATRVAIRGDVTDSLTGQATVTAIQCGAGNVSSLFASQVYTLQAGAPAMASPAPGPAVPWAPGGVRPVLATVTVDSNTPVAIRYTTDGTMPTCTTGTAVGNDASIPLASSTKVTAIACKTGYLPSTVATYDYVMQLAPPFLASQAAAGLGAPGWDWAGTAQPVTTMTIPADAGAPYGPFLVQQVGDPPCTGTAGAPELAVCTGAPNALADYVCWSKNGPVSCSCTSPIVLTPANPYAVLPAAADVAPGDTLSVAACQSSPPVNTTGVFAGASTTVTFQ
jgi:hypothetical protein